VEHRHLPKVQGRAPEPWNGAVWQQPPPPYKPTAGRAAKQLEPQKTYGGPDLQPMGGNTRERLEI